MVSSFNKNIIPFDEVQRLNALKSCEILDTEPEYIFTNLAQIIAQVYSVPIALISLVDKERVFFKANIGMPESQNVSRGVSLCSLAIMENEPTVFEDALKEPCLLANPLVAGEFGLRFYAGAPITTDDGYNIGTVCIVDKKTRTFSEADKELLSKFADTAMKAIKQRKKHNRS